jgi:hypothetical protein
MSMAVGNCDRRLKRTKNKGLGTAPRIKAMYASYMSCHNDWARTLSWLWAWRLRTKLDSKGIEMDALGGEDFH